MEDLHTRKRLDAELVELRQLDAIRTRAGNMGADGAAALAELIRSSVSSGGWGEEGLVHRVISCRVAIEQGYNEFLPKLASSFTATEFKDLEVDKYGVLTAAQVIRASLVHPSLTFAPLALSSWYLIFREFYGTRRNDASLGGASLGEKGGSLRT